MSDLHDILAFNRRHSNLQIDRLILCRSGVTPFGLYKQAAREVGQRHAVLVGLMLAMSEAKMELSDLERALPTTVSRDLTREKIKAVRARMKIQSLESDIANESREFARFLAHAVYHKSRLGVLAPERLERLDAEEWQAQIKRRVAVETMAYGHVSQSTLDDVMAMPKAQRLELLTAKQHPEVVMTWLTQHEHDVPELPALVSADDVKRMIERDVARLALPKSSEMPSGVPQSAEMSHGMMIHDDPPTWGIGSASGHRSMLNPCP